SYSFCLSAFFLSLLFLLCFFFFFFSSRRRHTRSKRDWSSDVCSSDLPFAGHSTNYTLYQQVLQLIYFLQVFLFLVHCLIYLVFYLEMSQQYKSSLLHTPHQWRMIESFELLIIVWVPKYQFVPALVTNRALM